MSEAEKYLITGVATREPADLQDEIDTLREHLALVEDEYRQELSEFQDLRRDRTRVRKLQDQIKTLEGKLRFTERERDGWMQKAGEYVRFYTQKLEEADITRLESENALLRERNDAYEVRRSETIRALSDLTERLVT